MPTHWVQNLEVVHDGIFQDEDPSIFEQHPIRHLPPGERWLRRPAAAAHRVRAVDARGEERPVAEGGG